MRLGVLNVKVCQDSGLLWAICQLLCKKILASSLQLFEACDLVYAATAVVMVTKHVELHVQTCDMNVDIAGLSSFQTCSRMHPCSSALIPK